MKKEDNAVRRFVSSKVVRVIALVVVVLLIVEIVVTNSTILKVPTEQQSSFDSEKTSEKNLTSEYKQATKYLEQEDYENTISISEEALKKYGDNEDTLNFKKLLAVSYFQTGNFAEAKKNVNAVIDSGSLEPELNFLRGVCEMSEEQFEMAIEDFTLALSVEELKDEALYNRGLCNFKLGKNEEAATDFQEIIDRDSDKETVDLVYELLGIDPEQIN